MDNIRSATKEDASAISEVFALSWKKAYRGMVSQHYLDHLALDFWGKTLLEELGSGAVGAKVALEEGKIIGCIVYRKSRIKALPNYAEIQAVYVHPDKIRKGYGQALLDSVLKTIKGMGYESCYLWVLLGNIAARSFYEKNRFVGTKDYCKVMLEGQELIDERMDYHF